MYTSYKDNVNIFMHGIDLDYNFFFEWDLEYNYNDNTYIHTY
jgi:hypothetical protein